jgi:tetratricopeptide (TPR) repeat protein
MVSKNLNSPRKDIAVFVSRPAFAILVAVMAFAPAVRPRRLLESFLAQRNQPALEYVQAAQAEPNSPAELLQEIETNFKIGDKARALELAKRGIEHDSQGSLSEQIGLGLLEHRCYPEAAAAFEKALTRAPQSLELASKLAYAYVGSNQPERAIRLLSQFEGRQSSWQASFLLGQAYELAGKPQEALPSFREAVRLNPQEASIHYELGRLLLQSSDRSTQSEGAEELRSAIRLDPQETDYYLDLGTWLLNQGELKSAVVLLTQGVEHTRPSDKLYLMLGMAQYWYGSGPAIPTLKKAIDLNPHSAPAYNLLGYCYLFGGDFGKALEYYRKAMAENPENGLYSYGAARALESLGKVDEAIRFAEESVRLEPKSSRNHYLLGKIDAKLGRYSEAVSQLETAVGLDPESESPYYLLARTYVRMNEPGKSREWTQKLQELTTKKRQTERRELEKTSAPSSETSDLPQPSEIWHELRGSQPGANPGPR